MIAPDPNITKDLLSDNNNINNCPMHFFEVVLPKLKSKKLVNIVEGVQKPGETVFIPGGWWYAVLNLDLAVTVTQKFCNQGNFEKVWLKMREERKKLSVDFLEKLYFSDFEMYVVANEMNKRDKFIMWDKRPDYRAKFEKLRK